MGDKYEHRTGSHGRLRILLEKKRGEGGEGQSQAGEEEAGRLDAPRLAQEIYPVEEDEDIRLFDLGTRLYSGPTEPPHTAFRSRGEVSKPVRNDEWVNGYLDIEYWVRVNQGDAGRMPDEQGLVTLDKLLLGSRGVPEGQHGDELDPLAKTPANVTGRAVPNVLPWNDAVFGQPALTFFDGADEHTLGPADWVKGPDVSGGERWASISKPLAPTNGRYRVEKQKWRHVRFSMPGLYQDFDTSDTAHWKVTQEPRFDAETVPFALEFPLSLYLVPALLMFTEQSSGGAQAHGDYYEDDGVVASGSEEVLEHGLCDPSGGFHPASWFVPPDWAECWRMVAHPWKTTQVIEGFANAVSGTLDEALHFATRIAVCPWEELEQPSDLLTRFPAASEHVLRTQTTTTFAHRTRRRVTVSDIHPIRIEEDTVLETGGSSGSVADVSGRPASPEAYETAATAIAQGFVAGYSNRNVRVTSGHSTTPLAVFYTGNQYVGHLIAIVRCRDRIFYVWRKQA